MRKVIRRFQSDGNAYNMDLGFIPSKVTVRNLTASDGDIAEVTTWADLLGTGEVQSDYANATSGGTHTIGKYVTEGLILSSYNAVTYDAGTENDDTDPVRATGKKGITIATGFMDDNDIVVVEAELTDVDANLGDVA